MALRNTPEGYGTVTKALHWTMVVALAAQLVVGYSIDRFDGLLEWAVDLLFSGEEDWLLVVHAALGVLILLLAVVRSVWRRTTPLPEWAAGLSAVERTIEHVVERVLYTLMFAIPISGLALVLVSDAEWDLGDDRVFHPPWPVADDILLLLVHIATHIAFFAALLTHVGLVLKHQLIDRDRLLNRML